MRAGATVRASVLLLAACRDDPGVSEGGSGGTTEMPPDPCAEVEPLPEPTPGPYLPVAPTCGDGEVDVGEVCMTFSSEAPLSGPIEDFPVALVGDLDGDALEDVALWSFHARDVVVLWGRGDGGLDMVRFTLDEVVAGAAIGDLDGDGLVELAVVSTGAGILVRWGCDAARSCTVRETIALEYPPADVFVGDYESDGDEDVVVLTWDNPGYTRTWALSYLQEAGQLVAGPGDRIDVEVGNPQYWNSPPIGGDFDGDALLDVVFPVGASDLRVQFGGGEVPFPDGLWLPDRIHMFMAGDFDGDARHEVAVSYDYELLVFDLDDRVAVPTVLELPIPPDLGLDGEHYPPYANLAARDMDADGITDLVVATSAFATDGCSWVETGLLHVVGWAGPGMPSSRWSAVVTDSLEADATIHAPALALTDLVADGAADVVVVGPDEDRPARLWLGRATP